MFWNQKYASKREGGNSGGDSGLYSALLFDCTTERLFDCNQIEPTLGLLSSILLHDSCAIHDTRMGVSMSVRLHRDWIMWNNYALINGHQVWLGRQRTLAEALALSSKWRKYQLVTLKE